MLVRRLSDPFAADSVEVAGTLYLEAPKGRKRRSTIYPARTPAGYPLADKLAARAEQARAEQDAGTNPLGLMFPSPRGTWWRSSNFDRRVLAPAYQAAGWRDPTAPIATTCWLLRPCPCTSIRMTSVTGGLATPADTSS